MTTAKILEGTVATDDLADNAVTGVKIAEGTITGADINASADLSIASLITSGTVTADVLDVSGGASVGGNLTVSGWQVVNVVTETDDYTATTSDRIILCSPTEEMTVSLPPAADAERLVLTIKNIDPIGEIAVYIAPDGDEEIDGVSGEPMQLWRYAFATIVSDGTAWWIISSSGR